MTTETYVAPPTSMSIARRQVWLDRLVTLTDDQFIIPGTKIRFGLDAVLGLILPQVGDSISGLLGAIVLFVAWKDGAPPTLLAKMAGNIAFDVLAGMVPILGDVVDVAYRSNRRNHTLLRAFQRERYGITSSDQELNLMPLVARQEAPSWLLGAVLVTGLIVLLALPIGLLFLLAHWLFG